MRRAFRVTAVATGLVLAVSAAAAVWLGLEIGASLPLYSGEHRLAGLSSPVTVLRDRLGVATIRSADRLDEARALGFVHAQERFFQMDLMRRAAAGELAALAGPDLVERDLGRRIHRMSDTAASVLDELPPDERRWLEVYAEGVNAGLAALDANPFEYLLLGRSPEAWRPEDSILVVAAMYFDLQDETAEAKHAEVVARSVLPEAVADFLYPEATAWDAPLVGEAGAPAAIPPAGVYDLRQLPPEHFADPAGASARGDAEDGVVLPGSNNWAVGGERTVSGGGILANDPHLELSVPSIWFRVSLERDGRRVTGASLPGIPAVVFGSNGQVAWGLTNSQGDWTDLVALDVDPADPSRYRTPEGWRTIETVATTIEVAGGDPVELEFEQSIFGPVLGRLPDGRPYAVRWVAHETAGYAFDFARLGGAETLAEAMGLAQSAGIPAQNFVAADRNGAIAWTIAGPIPRRIDADLPSDSATGSAWDGWLGPEAYPAVVNPDDSLIWTANGRVVDGPMLAAIGDGDYALGARAGQIRDRLRSLDEARIADMLAIQLDDEAKFLARWRDLLLELLEGQSDAVLSAVREAVRDWGGRAAVDSAGYRLVRGWRLFMVDRVTVALTAEISARHPDWTYQGFRAEHWVWPLVSEEPRHLLDPRHSSWRELGLDVLNDYLRETLAVTSPADLARMTWGELNRVHVRHPLSDALPWFSGWLDMPPSALPGDAEMPRVQQPEFGASARFAVSPGDETNGYFHMPGGQSGHPLSPYYGAGHGDWAAGRPTPFLPGDTAHELSLVPAP